MTQLPYALNLYNSVKRGSGFIADITDRAKNWKRSIRRIGGFWTGSFDYQGNPDELDDLFFDGLMKEVRETSGGVQAWQGFIGDMIYKRGSITWRRSFQDVSNAVKVLFTSQYSNLLTNGGAESGAWTADGSATTAQSTSWVTEGTYSCFIVISSGSVSGAIIQTGIPIEAGVAYNLSIDLKVIVNQIARVVIESVGGGPGKIVAKTTPGTAGVYTLQMTIPETNTYTGNVQIRVTNSPITLTSLQVYGDNAVFTQASNAGDTGWSTDAGSISEYGRLEETIVEGALSDAAAAARVATTLKRKAWPRLLAPDELSSNGASEYTLSVVCYGYVFTLPWIYNTYFSESTMSNYVTQLATNRDYVASSSVDTNSTVYTADNRYPITVWQVLKNIVTAGDSSGNLWALGMYANRTLTYSQFRTDIAYRYRNDKLYNPAGGEMEAWLALPGWAIVDDAPPVPYQTMDAMDDPRRVIVEEVEYTAPDTLRFRSKAVE